MAQVYIECFNKKLQEFITELIECFPQMKELKMLRSGLQLAVTMEPYLPQKVFDEHLHDVYENSILDKDENFFLNEDYQHIVDTRGIDLDIISTIKNMWKDLDTNNKEAIWKYLQVLVLLNRKCKSA
jgi:hypothetical protein